MTPRENLLALHDKLCSDAKGLMVRKNQDYAKSDDPLKNFRKRGLLGMLVRLEDKMARLDTFVETGILAVSEEPVDDLFRDIINYAILMQYWVNEERENQSQKANWADPSICGCGGTYTTEHGWVHGDNCKAWPTFRGDWR